MPSWQCGHLYREFDPRSERLDEPEQPPFGNLQLLQFSLGAVRLLAFLQKGCRASYQAQT